MSKSIEEERREHDRLYTECERLKAEVERLKGVIESENLAAAAEISAIRKSTNLQIGRLRDMLNDVRGLVYGTTTDVAAKILRRIEDGDTESRICPSGKPGDPTVRCRLKEGHEGWHQELTDRGAILTQWA